MLHTKAESPTRIHSQISIGQLYSLLILSNQYHRYSLTGIPENKVKDVAKEWEYHVSNTFKTQRICKAREVYL